MKLGLIGMGNMGIDFGANPLAGDTDLTVFDLSAPVSGGPTGAKFHLGEASRPRW